MSMAWVCDSANFDPHIYKDFTSILMMAFRHYVREKNGRCCPKRRHRLCIKTLCSFPKQRFGSLHCGYYVCNFMSTTKAYKRHPDLWLEEQENKRDVYKDDQLLELVGDLCNFIMDHVIYFKGDYHDFKSDLGSNPRYQHLCELDRLSLGR